MKGKGRGQKVAVMLKNGQKVRYEPPDDKTNKMACAPSADSDHPGHLPSLISHRCLHEETLGP